MIRCASVGLNLDGDLVGRTSDATRSEGRERPLVLVQPLQFRGRSVALLRHHNGSQPRFKGQVPHDQDVSATWVYRLLTTAYANGGRLEEAKKAAAKLLEAFPDLTVSKAIDAAPGQPDTIARYAQGLREAGLPEQ